MASKILTRLIKVPAVAVLRIFDFLVETFAVNKEVWAKNTFPFSQLLRDNQSVFLQEYNQLLNEKEIRNVKDFFIVETDINQDDNWKAAPLVLFNYLFKENAERCPETFKIISLLPGCFGAMFSVLGPGKYIPPHRGIYKGSYRCLLTLKVSANAECWIRVNGEKLYFEEGECIVFDETIEHEVKNGSPSPRVVLFLDLYRKLPFPLNALNYVLFTLMRKSPFVKTILNEYNRLEKTSFEDFKPTKAILA